LVLGCFEGGKNPMEAFLTRKEVADRLRVTPETVSEWVKAGKLTAKRIGKKLLIPESSVKEAVK